MLKEFVVPYSLVQADGKILRMNDAMCQLTGKSDSYHGNISAVRFHDFNGFPYREFISLGNPAEPAVILCFHVSQIRILFQIRILVINLGIGIWLSVEETSGKLAVRTV